MGVFDDAYRILSALRAAAAMGMGAFPVARLQK